MRLVLPAVGALLLGAALGASQSDVAEELWIRSTARRLAEAPSHPSEPPQGAAEWRQRTVQLEAYARAGVWAPAGAAAWDEDDRVEVAAAKLRVLPWLAASAAEFERRLARGLRSRFGAVRSAALHRAALWTLERSALDGRASRFLATELKRGEMPADVQESLFQIALKSGDGRRFKELLSLPLAARVLEERDRAGWDPVLGFFEDIVALPVSAEELVELGYASGLPKSGACVQIVAHVRDGVPLASSVTDLVRSAISDRDGSLDVYELDEVAEALVVELTLPGREGPHAASESLGLALLEEAARPSLGTASRDRCLRTAARLLPVTHVLEAGGAFDEAAALELWDALNRRDDWPKTPALLEGLLPWLDHDSVDVAEAALRAVGARYAYGGRAGLEDFLVKALRHDDPKLRSLAFPWLAKSLRPPTTDGPSSLPTPLDVALFEAWTREGSESPSPRLTERQGRWLGRLPRDRQAVLFRGALLDILALEGSGEPAVGAGSLELLAAFHGDREVFQRVAILLERSLLGIEAKSNYLARLPFDASAARAVRILHGVDPEGAVELIHQALRRSMGLLHGSDANRDARPQLPKMAVGLLARGEAGRDQLGALMGPDVPRRVRFEAALQLIGRHGTAEEPAKASVVLEAGQRLMLDFDRVDGALRLRAIEALAAPRLLSMSEVDAFLQGLVVPGNDEAERSMAIEAMGQRRDLSGLKGVLNSAIGAAGPDAGTIDAAANAARALRLAPGQPAARVALAMLSNPTLAAAEERQLETVRGELMEALCSLLVENEQGVREGAESWVSVEEAEAALGAVLAVPSTKARREGAQQFRSGRRAESHFLWASELAALKLLLRSPELLQRAIGGSDQWGHLDGRMLLALAQVVASSGGEASAARAALALDLATASGVALAGEGDAPSMCTMQAWACVLSFENQRSCRLARKHMEGGDTVAAEIEKGSEHSSGDHRIDQRVFLDVPRHTEMFVRNNVHIRQHGEHA